MNRRVHVQLRLSDGVWKSIKRVRLHLESHILVAEGVAAHVSPDEALRLLLAEQGLYQEPLTERDQQYLLHVMRIIRRPTTLDDASSPPRTRRSKRHDEPAAGRRTNAPNDDEHPPSRRPTASPTT